MGIVDRLQRRARRVVKRVADRVGASGRGAAHPDVPPPPATAPPTNSSTSADVFATADRAVLTGLVGIRMALAPQGRPMLINHWATWCDGCVEELPHLVALRERWRGRVDFVAVGWEGFSGPIHLTPDPTEQLRAVERVAEQYGLDWPTLVFDGSPEALFDGLGLDTHTVPQTHLLGADGTVLLSVTTPLDDTRIAELEAALES